MHFGATLRLLRTGSGVSLRALAEAVGVSSAYLSRVENGHDPAPTPDRVVAIAGALGLPPHELLEVSRRVAPQVAAYLDRVPAASALVREIARRELSGPQVARLRAVLDAEFPLPPTRAGRAPRLGDELAATRVVRGLGCDDVQDAFDIAAARLVRDAGRVGAAWLASSIALRERDATSCIGAGVMLPHAVQRGFPEMTALVILARPLEMATPDGQPVQVMAVTVLADQGKRSRARLMAGARLAQPDVVRALLAARDARAVMRVVEQRGL